MSDNFWDVNLAKQDEQTEELDITKEKEEIKQSQRELESQLKHLQKNHNDLLDDVGRAKHAYEDAKSALSKERGNKIKK